MNSFYEFRLGSGWAQLGVERAQGRYECKSPGQKDESPSDESNCVGSKEESPSEERLAPTIIPRAFSSPRLETENSSQEVPNLEAQRVRVS